MTPVLVTNGLADFSNQIEKDNVEDDVVMATVMRACKCEPCLRILVRMEQEADEKYSGCC